MSNTRRMIWASKVTRSSTAMPVLASLPHHGNICWECIKAGSNASMYLEGCAQWTTTRSWPLWLWLGERWTYKSLLSVKGSRTCTTRYYATYKMWLCQQYTMCITQGALATRLDSPVLCFVVAKEMKESSAVINKHKIKQDMFVNLIEHHCSYSVWYCNTLTLS